MNQSHNCGSIKYTQRCVYFSTGAALGFSLVELLMVMAVVISMVGLVVPAFTGLGRSNALNGGGSLVAGLANSARQNSLAKNAMTALIVVTDPTVDNQNRLFTIMELLPPADGHTPVSSDWKQISKWESLSPGIAVSNWEVLGGNANAVSPALPTLNYAGRQISQYNSLIFLPDGSTNSNSPTTIELAACPQGSTTPAKSDIANNYRLTVLNATGRIKIDRQ